MSRRLCAAVLLGAAFACPVGAPAAPPNLDTILRASSGALRLDALREIRTLHVRGSVAVYGLQGRGDGWRDVRSGAFADAVDAGPASGAQGFDGTNAWDRDAKGVVWNDASAQRRLAAVDAAYMNRYALWSPGYGGASVTARHVSQSGRQFDVVTATPKGGSPIDVWIDATTHLPERTVHSVAGTTTQVVYADYRSVHGLRVPFSVLTDLDGNASVFHASSVVANDADADRMLRRPQTHVDDVDLAAGTTSVPVELVDDRVAVPVSINGKGPYRFLLDTASSNVVDDDVAAAAGLRAANPGARGGLQLTSAPAVRIGDATLRDQTFIMAPVRRGLGIATGKPVDGVIGFDLLARFVATLDYAGRRLVLRTPAAGAADAAANARTIPFVFAGQKPMIACAIDGVPTTCVIDSGSSTALTALVPFLAEHTTVVPAVTAPVGIDDVGLDGPAIGRLGRTTLEAAGFTLSDVITGLPTPASATFTDPFYGGDIGGGVLGKFTVTFDYAHQTVTLAPNAAFATRESYDRSGVFLLAHDGAIVAGDVRPGTPAADAGVLAGDTIVSIDGKNAASLGLAAVRDLLRRAPGTAVVLVLTGPGGARTATVTLADYV